MHTLGNVLWEAVKSLKEASIDNPVLDSEVILMHLLNIDRIDIIKNRESVIDRPLVKEFFHLIEERKKGKPVQYIVGQQEFMGLSFSIGPGVLIPRPDTEIVVERTIELLKGKKNIKLADVCTGSGAIAISLAHYLENSYVYATDISKEALKFCKINAKKNYVEDRIKILQGDLLEPLFCENLEGELDVLVSNPPYIDSGDMGDLPDSVRCYEPHLALDGGEKGIDYYKRILKDVPKLLKKEGLLIFEIGYNQGHFLLEMVEELGVFRGIEIEKDLAGLDRCIYCYFGGVDKNV